MKTILKISLSFVLALASAYGQTALTQTTLSSAVAQTDKIINLTSATGVSAPSLSSPGSVLYVVAPGATRGEAMNVQSVNSTAVTVARGRNGAQTAFPSGARVLIGNANYFQSYDPSGGCTAASTAGYTPWVNIKTGTQWLCSTVTLSWVPGFGNILSPAQPTAAVASAAGAITPSGPLFHVTGTAAITGFTLPVGFVGSSFTIIPDAIFTTTAAGNIAIASTAVVGKALIYTYDAVTAKFYPTY